MIFTRTCDNTRKMALMLRNLGFDAIPIHGQMAQAKRIGALNKFKAGERSILVATGVYLSACFERMLIASHALGLTRLWNVLPYCLQPWQHVVVDLTCKRFVHVCWWFLAKVASCLEGYLVLVKK